MQINTPIYYKGDQANPEGQGKIIGHHNTLNKIKVNDSIFYISDNEINTPIDKSYKRFYTIDQYKEDRQNKINKFNQLINKNK